MNTRIPTLIAAALVACAAVGAQAAEGAYVGGAISAPDYHDSINGVGGHGGGEGVGGKVYGGYQFTPNFAVEGGYFGLGRSKDVDGTARVHGVYLDGVGSIEVAPKFSLQGSVGVAHGQLDTSAGDDSSPALKLGVGVQYEITPTVALRAGYDHYHFTDAFDGKPNVGQAVLGVKVGF